MHLLVWHHFVSGAERVQSGNVNGTLAHAHNLYYAISTTEHAYSGLKRKSVFIRVMCARGLRLRSSMGITHMYTVLQNHAAKVMYGMLSKKLTVCVRPSLNLV